MVSTSLRGALYFRVLAIASIVSFVIIAIMQSPSAFAATNDPNDVLNGGGTVQGGTVQHDDPSAYNYVPEENSTEIVPMSAQGYEFIPAFTYNEYLKL